MCHFILNLKDIRKLTVIPLRPTLEATTRVDQPDCAGES
jgi:hypothetical protein